jgi:probable rRNA maturation factor
VPVYFHSEDVGFLLDKRRLYKKWITQIFNQHKKKIGNLNIVFCSNSYILEINRKYLNHNYFTDVITFDYDHSDKIDGDIFVSIDQVIISCADLHVNFNEELRRVIIHGVYHLLGYRDDSAKDIERIRKMEDSALIVWRGLENGENL